MNHTTYAPLTIFFCLEPSLYFLPHDIMMFFQLHGLWFGEHPQWCSACDPACTLHFCLDEEKSKYACLAQQNDFGPTFLQFNKAGTRDRKAVHLLPKRKV
jgi:hypothetical protein